MASTSLHEKFSTRLGFLLATIGAAVGLGNLWKFPYMLGSNGGGAFVLVYLVAIVFIALPVMIGEMMIGKYGRASAPKSFMLMAETVKASQAWRYVGWLGIVTLFLVLSFFSVIAGWSIAYVFKTLAGTFTDMTPAEVGAHFGDFLHQPWTLTLWHAVFMAVVVFTIARGVKAGIEKAIMLTMPALFVMLVGLVVYGMFVGEFGQALAYLFKPDMSKITPEVILSAFGQAFFSVNVGVGAVLTYAAYLPDDTDIVRSSIIIGIGDTLVALLAGLMIFPIVFAYGLDPGEGPGLIFVTLSAAFGAMPGGSIIGALFFVLVFFAAFSSALSMLEVCVARFSEKEGLSREKAAVLAGIVIFFVGFITLGSFNFMEDVRLIPGIERFADMTPFGLLDFAITNVMMPVGAMLYAIFIGWFITSDLAREILQLEAGALFSTWRFLMRYVVPIAILAIFLFNLVAT
jgi:NSS family neurotransmitter:Na+ symporter